jgi:hypothetical protein
MTGYSSMPYIGSNNDLIYIFTKYINDYFEVLILTSYCLLTNNYDYFKLLSPNFEISSN